MQPAVVWDGDKGEHAPSVMNRLRERAATIKNHSIVEHTAVVLVFCHPQSPVARQLADRNEYFDLRTGADWDVFFPGYFRWGWVNDPHAVELGNYWGFSPAAFDS